MADMMGATDVAFPNLGIYLNDLPKSFSIFGYEIALYGLIIGLGMVFGFLLAVDASCCSCRNLDCHDCYYDLHNPWSRHRRRPSLRS